MIQEEIPEVPNKTISVPAILFSIPHKKSTLPAGNKAPLLPNCYFSLDQKRPFRYGRYKRLHTSSDTRQD
jgi:hypothetical protein